MSTASVTSRGTKHDDADNVAKYFFGKTTTWGDITNCAAYQGYTEKDTAPVEEQDGLLDALLLDKDGDLIYREREKCPWPTPTA